MSRTLHRQQQQQQQQQQGRNIDDKLAYEDILDYKEEEKTPPLHPSTDVLC